MEGLKGLVYVLVGPSASGKTTLFKGVTEGYYTLTSGEKKKLPEDCSEISGTIKKVITATTRKPRPGEIEGVHYRFLSKSQFETERANGNIVEETVYAGENYGILASEINKIFKKNLDGIIILDSHGVKELKRMYGKDSIISIFIYRNIEKLGEELRKRSVSEEEVNSRLKIAVDELEMKDDFDHIIYNTGALEESFKKLCKIINKTRTGC